MTACEAVEAELSAYLDGELSAEERIGVEAHLRNCPACRSALGELRNVATLLSEIPGAKAPSALAANIRRDIDDVIKEKTLQTNQRVQPVQFSHHPRRPHFMWGPALLGVAALLMLSLLGLVVLPALEEREPRVASSTPAPIVPIVPSIAAPKPSSERAGGNEKSDKLEMPVAPRSEAAANLADARSAPEKALPQDLARAKELGEGQASPSDPGGNPPPPALTPPPTAAPAPVVALKPAPPATPAESQNAAVAFSVPSPRSRPPAPAPAPRAIAQKDAARNGVDAIEEKLKSDPATRRHLGESEAIDGQLGFNAGAKAQEQTAAKKFPDAKTAEKARVMGEVNLDSDIATTPKPGSSNATDKLRASDKMADAPLAPFATPEKAAKAETPQRAANAPTAAVAAKREFAPVANADEKENRRGAAGEQLAEQQKNETDRFAFRDESHVPPTAPTGSAAAATPGSLAPAAEAGKDFEKRSAAVAGTFGRAMPAKLVFRTRDPNALVAQLRLLAEAHQATLESAQVATDETGKEDEAKRKVLAKRDATPNRLAFAVVGSKDRYDAVLKDLQDMQQQGNEPEADAPTPTPKAPSQSALQEPAKKQAQTELKSEAAKGTVQSRARAKTPPNDHASANDEQTRIEIQIEVIP